MATILSKLNDFKKLNSFIRSEVLEIIRGHEDVIINLNREQLERGELFNEEPIRPEYQSSEYATQKQQLNSRPAYGTPDLLLTGAFYGGFFLTVKGETFEIDSTDYKKLMLTYKYGNYIFGLSSSSLEIYTKNYFFPELKAFIEDTAKVKLI